MQKKVLFSIFAILTLFVAVLLVLLISGTNSDVYDFVPNEQGVKDSNSTKKATLQWAKKLSSYKKSDYLLPVTDLYIKIKYAENRKNKTKQREKKREKLFSLTIDKLDEYSLFCILRILDEENGKYVIERGFGDSKIYIDAKNRSDLNGISQKLKLYNIQYDIKEIER
ncbi:MAG: hypothetical protein GXO12_01750 [Epsilonproteobacteria bacterium]|nr:hypothetical protein [Campylobacterota bacterium]